MANAQTNEENIVILKKCIDKLAIEVGNQFQRINTVSSGNPEFNISSLETSVTSSLVAAINSLVFVQNDQLRIESGRLFLETDNNKDLIFKSDEDIIMEIPNFETERFSCGMYNEGPGNVFFVPEEQTNLVLMDGNILRVNKVATLFKILNENNQILKGELVT